MGFGVQRTDDGDVVVSLKKLALLVGVISTIGVAGGRWVFGVDRVVNVDYPEHKAQIIVRQDKIDEVLGALKSIEAQRAEKEERDRVLWQMKCEDPKTDLPKDFCDDVLVEARMNETRRRKEQP